MLTTCFLHVRILRAIRFLYLPFALKSCSIAETHVYLMTKPITKIGLIQTAPLPGDFSNNLRAIVQGYRNCLDHGAEVVVASAAALCGLEPQSLVNRRSFISQAQQALQTLASELSSAPLFLAAYTLTVSDDELYVGIAGEDDEEEDPWMANDRRIVLTPYLLEKDSITELSNGETMELQGMRFYIDTTDDEALPDGTPDFIVRLPGTPWYGGSARDEEEARSWEANMEGCHLICCRPVGTAGGNIYGGGSAVYSAAGKTLQRLPFFEVASKVVDITRPALARHLPEEAGLMSLALQRGIRDSVRNNGFTGACLNLDHPHSALLGALCVEALGTANVSGVSFTPGNKLAEQLGIQVYTPDTTALNQAATAALGGEENRHLQERLQTALALTHAEARGMMLCSPLCRRELMLGEFCTYGMSGGQLAPLGNLYDVDIFLLCEHLGEKYPQLFGSLTEPPHGVTNRIIHELADCNTAPSVLLNKEKNYLFKENDVRLIQRKILASALKRAQLPVILHVDPKDEQLKFPISHRLND